MVSPTGGRYNNVRLNQRKVSQEFEDLENNPILKARLSEMTGGEAYDHQNEDDDDDDDVTFESSYGEEEDEDMEIYTNRMSDASQKTIVNYKWKPKTETTYETLTLTKSEWNSRIRGAGFREDGKPRHIKMTGCLLSDIRRRCK